MTEINPIAHISCDLKSKFGVPRQSGIVEELKGKIVFEKEYSDPEAFRGIEEYTYIWVIWQFSKNVGKEHSPTVRPPILGGNKRVGVFATRSSFRPNDLALSCVRLDSIIRSPEGNMILEVSGIDMADGTPVFDIKPYIPKWDVKENADGGFTERHEKRLLKIKYDCEMKKRFKEEQFKALVKLLEQDPRPAYKNDPDKIYGFDYADFEIKFKVNGDELEIISISDER